MNRVTPQIESFALRLITHETKGSKTTETIAEASFRVFEKLQQKLALLMGNGGYRALLSRALALANAEISWLNMLRVNADGSLDEADELGAQIAPNQMVEGYSALLAQLLGLMVAFIGEKITLGLLSEVWPKFKISKSELESQYAFQNSQDVIIARSAEKKREKISQI